MTQIATTKPTVIVTRPGEPHPPLVDLSEVPKDGPVFEGTDVPVQYLYEYLDKAHNLYPFLDAFPEMSAKQAIEAMRERVEANTVVESDREYVSGAPRFKGTRAPVYVLFEFLAAGENLDEFLDCFPTVGRKQAIEALILATNTLESVSYEVAIG